MKLAAVHGGFLVYFVAYCVFVISQWVNVSHSIDLVAYLDSGDAYWRGDFHNGINHYWSPMYSWILGAVLAIVKPDIAHEMVAVRSTNLAIMMFLYAAFVLYATTLWSGITKKWLGEPGNAWLTKPIYWIFMYSVFCFSSLSFGGPEKDGPDVLTAGFAILASTAFLKIKFGKQSLSSFLFMGFSLGFGYLSKAIILPVSLFYYVATWWEMRREKFVWKKLATAFGAEMLVALPFILLISITFGYPTISDAGRPMWLWCEEQSAQQVHFQFPELKHRSNIIFKNPVVYEFEEPFHVTYSPWYNPGYWTQWVVDRDPIWRPLRWFSNNVSFFLSEIFSYLIGGVVLASLIMKRPCFTWSGLKEALPICAPAMVALGAYSVSANLNGHMMERYFIAWTMLLYSAAMVALVASSSNQSAGKSATIGKRTMLLSIAACMMIFTSAFYFYHLHIKQQYPLPYDVMVATKARELGLKPGDKIAQVGFRRYFWARLARLRIVADIFDISEFWAMDAASREQLVDTLRKHGVKAIIQTWAIDVDLPEAGPGWVKVPNTKARIFIIPPAERNRAAAEKSDLPHK